MSEEERQKSLARAKKKLREFQERNSLLPVETPQKRRARRASDRRDRSSPSSEDHRSPVEIQDILEALVFDLNCSNGVVLPSLDKWKAEEVPTTCPPLEHPSGGIPPSGSIPPVSVQMGLTGAPHPLVDPANNATVSPSSIAETGADGIEPADISAQEKMDYQQKFAKEQGALREQLQVHIQTIGILVSEKCDLQTALMHTQQAMKKKERESEELANKLHTLRLRVMELEQTLSAASSRQKQADKHNKELTEERDFLKMELFKNNKNSDDLKEVNLELEEKLRISAKEKATMQHELDDVKKQLEMSESLLLQFSSPSEVLTDEQQLQRALEERTRLEKEVEQLQTLLKNLQVDRDYYVQKLSDETAFWQGKTQRLVEQMDKLKDDKEKSVNKVQELETAVTELKSQIAVPLPPEPSKGPSEMEQHLQAEKEDLQKQLENMAARLQEQVKDNSELSELNLAQGCRLAELERQSEIWSEQAETRKKILETMENDRTTISRAMLQNQQLKEQLAELQDGFIKLTNDNVDITNALQSEQHAKKELEHKMAVLQQDKEALNETMTKKTQEAENLQQQRDEYHNQLQQYAAAFQKQVDACEELADEKEILQKHLVKKDELIEQLEHEGHEAKAELVKTLQDLLRTQELLDTARRQNEKLQYKLNFADAIKMELEEMNEEIEQEEMEEEEKEKKEPWSNVSLPEDPERLKALLNFYNMALAKAKEDPVGLHNVLNKETLCHQCMAGIATSTQPQMNKEEAPIPGTEENSTTKEGSTLIRKENTTTKEGNTVTREAYQALQGAMDKLQTRFTDLMNERVELKDQVEELEHRCIQLSGETDTIGDYITLYQHQRAVLKERYKEKEAYINRLAQEKEEMKIKMLELQELVLKLVADNKEKQDTTLADTQNCSEEPTTAAQKQEFVTSSHSVASPDGNMGSTLTYMENTTERQIIQLLQEIQKDPKQSPGLGSNPCMPFFYEADENDQVKILVI